MPLFPTPEDSCPTKPETYPPNQIPADRLFNKRDAHRGITYAEVFGSPQEAYQGQEGRMARTFLVNWDQRWTFCQAMIGWSEAVALDGTYYVHRVPPLPYKDAQGLFRQNAQDDNSGTIAAIYWLYPTQVQAIEGLGPLGKSAFSDQDVQLQDPPTSSITSTDTETANYRLAKVTLLYESIPYKVRTDEEMALLATQNARGGFTIKTRNGAFSVPDEGTIGRYVSHHFAPNAEFLTLPLAVLYWAQPDRTTTTPGPVTANAGLIVSTTEVVYTWHQVPANVLKEALKYGPPAKIIPRAARDALGCVNLNRFDFAPPGTLLLTGVDVKPYRMVGGNYVGDIQYRMKYFNAIDPSTGFTYDTVVQPGVGAVGGGLGVAAATGIQSLFFDHDDSLARGHNYFLHWKNNGGDPTATTAYTHDLITHNGLFPDGDPRRGPPSLPAFLLGITQPGGLPVFRSFDFANLFRLDQTANAQ